jgi:hypothetical protein
MVKAVRSNDYNDATYTRVYPGDEEIPTPTPTYDGGHKNVNEKLFDITCIIGSVFSGGDEDPRIVAFRMIGEHNADGEFSFPNEDGSICHVGVYTENPKR